MGIVFYVGLLGAGFTAAFVLTKLLKAVKLI
ncbi:MAG: hypothetical protein RLZZ89_781 [Cyanobacteriota bacterium]|jgi:hypothetical protein